MQVYDNLMKPSIGERFPQEVTPAEGLENLLKQIAQLAADANVLRNVSSEVDVQLKLGTNYFANRQCADSDLMKTSAYAYFEKGKSLCYIPHSHSQGLADICSLNGFQSFGPFQVLIAIGYGLAYPIGKLIAQGKENAGDADFYCKELMGYVGIAKKELNSIAKTRWLIAARDNLLEKANEIEEKVIPVLRGVANDLYDLDLNKLEMESLSALSFSGSPNIKFHMSDIALAEVEKHPEYSQRAHEFRQFLNSRRNDLVADHPVTFDVEQAKRLWMFQPLLDALMHEPLSRRNVIIEQTLSQLELSESYKEPSARDTITMRG